MAKQQFMGPNLHTSLDKTTNPGYVNYRPEGEDADYPKYLFHKDGGGKVVKNKDEHDAIGGEYSVEPPNQEVSHVPFGADGDELEGKSRSELAEFGNFNYGMALKATQSKAELLEAVKQAAARKAAGTLEYTPQGENQTLPEVIEGSRS